MPNVCTPQQSDPAADPHGYLAAAARTPADAAGPLYDLDALRQWVQLLALPVELRVLNAERGGRGQGTVSGYYTDADALVSAAAEWSGHAPAVYVSLNPVIPDIVARSHNNAKPFTRATATDDQISRRVWLPVDVDPVRPPGISSTDPEHAAALVHAVRVRDYLTGRGFPAPVMGDSGNGGHCLFKCDWPNDADHAELARRFLVHVADALPDPAVELDKKVFNPARIWKCYGTRAAKGDHCPELGRPHRLARLLDIPAELVRVDAATVRELVGATTTRAATPPTPTTRKPNRPAAAADKNNDVPAAVRDAADAVRAAGPRSVGGYDPDTVRELVTRHGGRDDAGRPFGDGGLKWSVPCPWGESHTNGKPDGSALFMAGGRLSFKCQHRSCEGRSARDALAAWGETIPEGDAGIVVNGRHWPGLAADIRAALDAHNDPPSLFTAGNQMVRVEGGRVHALATDDVRLALSKAADWYVCRHTKAGPVKTAVLPPEPVVRNVVADAAGMGLPALNGVVHAPVLVPGGRVLGRAGYDAPSGLYLAVAGEDWPAVPDAPTPDDVAAARELLLTELLGDFPFQGQADRANAVALLVLPFVRPLIDGPTPIHILDAPSEGTGKSLLADVMATIWTGRAAESHPEPDHDPEWRKVLTTQLSAAPVYVFIDNVHRALNSGALASATTQRMWTDRILGANRAVTVPVRCVWLVSGNNVHGSREIARRVVRVRLDARCEDPRGRRGFRHADLMGWTRANRGALVRAALVLARAWAAAGMRDGTGPAMGSFERYVGVLSGILDTAGVVGFLNNLGDAVDEMNEADSQMGQLLAAVRVMKGDAVFTAADAVHVIIRDPAAYDTIDGTAMGIGRRLARCVGRVWGGLRLERVGFKRGDRGGYRVVQLDPAAAADPAARPDLDPARPAAA